jgi:hypothetical protein
MVTLFGPSCLPHPDYLLKMIALVREIDALPRRRIGDGIENRSD